MRWGRGGWGGGGCEAILACTWDLPQLSEAEAGVWRGATITVKVTDSIGGVGGFECGGHKRSVVRGVVTLGAKVLRVEENAAAAGGVPGRRRRLGKGVVYGLDTMTHSNLAPHKLLADQRWHDKVLCVCGYLGRRLDVGHRGGGGVAVVYAEAAMAVNHPQCDADI